ncbi:MAG: GldG family protein [Candidatus Riflebacteria bacterium]|nr:GldG family protein [Candidatus Riflebacteria bacterium]
MNKSNRPHTSIWPYFLLLSGIFLLILSGVLHFSLDTSSTLIRVDFFVLIAVILIILAFIFRPRMIKEIFFSRKTLLWINDALLILSVVAIAMQLSYISFRRNIRIDLTRTKYLSLSDLTLKTLRELDKEVKVTAFYRKNTHEYNLLKDLFDEYKSRTNNFTYSIVDPLANPAVPKQMNVTDYGTVAVEHKTNRKDLFISDLFWVPRQFGEEEEAKFTGEEALTSAILDVTTGVRDVAVFITGHDEASLNSFKSNGLALLNRFLSSDNMEIIEHNLLDGPITPRAKVAFIVAPKRDFLPEEIEKLRDFVTIDKGNLFCAIDPVRSLNNFNAFLLNEFGLYVNYDLAVDPQGVSSKYWTIYPKIAKHEVTAPLLERNLRVVLFAACSVLGEEREGLKLTNLLTTADNSWAMRGLENRKDLLHLEFRPRQDIMGPFSVGYFSEKVGDAGQKALLIGDADFMTTEYLGQAGNRDFINNTLQWMAGNKNRISIKPRTFELPEIAMDQKKSIRIFAISVLLVPLLVLASGFVVNFLRRRF